jgi:IS605 OrfB family transposase
MNTEKTEEFDVKLLEFKIYPNATQHETLERWLRAQQHIWNVALSLLIEYESFTAYNKIDKATAACCPLPWDYIWRPIDSGEDWRSPAIVESLPKKDPLRVKYIPVPIARIGTKHLPNSSCPLPQVYREPQLDQDSEYSLVKWFGFQKLPEQKPPNGAFLDIELITFCPQKHMAGTLKILATAWKEYKKGKRKRPRFKGRRNPMLSMTNYQSGNAQLVGGDYLKLPKFGTVKAKGLTHRWATATSNVRNYVLKKEPSGWYIFLCGRFPLETTKASSLVAGLDAGVKHLLTDDLGHHIENPEPLKKNLVKMQRLQRQAARQYQMNGGKTKNWEKTQEKIRQLHEKIRRQRKAYSHKISTFTTDKFGEIYVEDLQHQNMRRRAKAVEREDGKGYEHNRQSQKRGLNRALSDAGMGQLITMIEEKSKAKGRIFQRIDPKYTSQTCFQCGHTDPKNRQSQASFVCVKCGYSDNADVNAAKNIKRKGKTG